MWINRYLYKKLVFFKKILNFGRPNYYLTNMSTQNSSLEKTNAAFDAVLIVEDDPISSLLLQEYLKMENYQIKCACDGAEAVSEIKKQKGKKFLVLMDIVMPKMDGIEAAKRIKKIDKNIPVIAQTSQSYNLKDYDMSCFDEVIVKPIDFNKLKETMNLYRFGTRQLSIEEIY